MGFGEIKDRLRVDPAILDALGVTAEQMADMGLHGFFELATDKGFDVNVSTKRTLTGAGHLSIQMVDPDTYSLGKGGS